MQNGSGSANSGTRRVTGAPTLPSGVVPSNPEVNSTAQAFKHQSGTSSSPSSTDLLFKMQNPVNSLAAKFVLSNDYIQVDKNSNNFGSEKSQTDQEADGKAWRHDKSGLEGIITSDLLLGLTEEKAKKELQNSGRAGELLEVKKNASEERLVRQLPQDGLRKQVKLRSNTLAFNRTAIGVQGSTRRDKLKHLKSVQLQFHSESDEPFSDSRFVETKKIDISGNVNIGGRDCTLSEREEETANIFSDNKVKLKSKVEMLEEETSEATAAGAGPYSLVDEHGISTSKIQFMEKAKEIDLSKNFHKDAVSYSISKGEETKNSFSGNNIDLESKVEMLEEELMEAAALEAGLYSVVAEHGSSANKVLAPARRLSRFYLHACKASSLAKRASAARALISGLVLVTKACGNDVPRYVSILEFSHFTNKASEVQQILVDNLTIMDKY